MYAVRGDVSWCAIARSVYHDQRINFYRFDVQVLTFGNRIHRRAGVTPVLRPLASDRCSAVYSAACDIAVLPVAQIARECVCTRAQPHAEYGTMKLPRESHALSRQPFAASSTFMAYVQAAREVSGRYPKGIRDVSERCRVKFRFMQNRIEFCGTRFLSRPAKR